MLSYFTFFILRMCLCVWSTFALRRMFLYRKSIGSVAIEKAQDESVRRSGISTVGAAANIEFPGMFPTIEEDDTRYN